MVQIIEEQPSFGQIMARSGGTALGNLAGGALQGLQQRRENQALERMGLDLSGVGDPEIRKLLVQGSMRKKADDTEKFTTALDTLEKMREIVKRGNVGRGSSIPGFFPGKTAKDRAEFAQLGTALIPLVAAGVPIRNQKEFEQYRKIITDPSAPLSEMTGALDALEHIFQQKVSGKEQRKEKELKKVRFSSSNPEHQAKAKQLYKTYQDKEKVREILKREFEGL